MWWTQVGFDLKGWTSPASDGASAFIKSSVCIDALQSSGHGTDARVALQTANAAIGVEGVGKSLPLLHVGVRGREVTWDDHGYGVLQLLSTLIPKAGAHGLEVEHLGVNITQASACRSPSAAPHRTSCATTRRRRGGGGRVYGAVDVSTCLAVMREESPLLRVPLLVLRVHGHESQHC